MDTCLVSVLLVDDDEDDYVMTRDVLAESADETCALEWVATYEAALEAMERTQHDVYLVDYRLGERDGLELVRAALEQGCKAPIIVLTGQGDHEVDVKAMQAGAVDYLIKGQFDGPLLERAIRYAVENARLFQQVQHQTDELRLTNAALRTTKDYAQNIIESSLDIIISVDPHRHITEFNRAAQMVIAAPEGSHLTLTVAEE